MALPKIESPTFSTKLPTGEEIKFRPFTVKEQKVLLITAEGGMEKDIVNGLVELVNACTFNKIDWLKQPTVNLEHAFLHIRSKSVGEVVEVTLQCKHTVNGKECNHKTTLDVDVRNAVAGEFPETTIKITDNISIVLEHITVKNLMDMLEKETSNEDLVFSKTKMVIYGDEVITEFKKEEFKEFVDSFPPEAAAKVDLFFKDQPSLILKIDSVCPKCENASSVEIKGVLNFFG